MKVRCPIANNLSSGGWQWKSEISPQLRQRHVLRPWRASRLRKRKIKSQFELSLKLHKITIHVYLENVRYLNCAFHSIKYNYDVSYLLRFLSFNKRSSLYRALNRSVPLTVNMDCCKIRVIQAKALLAINDLSWKLGSVLRLTISRESYFSVNVRSVALQFVKFVIVFLIHLYTREDWWSDTRKCNKIKIKQNFDEVNVITLELVSRRAISEDIHGLISSPRSMHD